MQPLPAQDLRSNLGTWAVVGHDLPAVGAALVRALPPEPFDPDFRGQNLTTTYFDTPHFDLRRARRKADRYLTLRLRCYRAPNESETYALSAKTESQKFRRELDATRAGRLLGGNGLAFGDLLPPDLVARLADLAGGAPVRGVVAVMYRRYAAEDDEHRLTLDVHVRTDTGLRLPFAVLEFKALDASAPPPDFVARLGLRPLKLSKFLWSTNGGR
jgi:hypothetical protein